MKSVNRPSAVMNMMTRRDGGFTLLEMIVAGGIFTAVVTIAVGAVLAIGQAQVKASNIQNVQDNLRFALELISREMRTGRDFRLPATPGCPPACGEVFFTATRIVGGNAQSYDVGYCFDAVAQELRRFLVLGGCAGGVPVTDESIRLEEAVFYVIGETIGASDGQPRITTILRASSRDPRLVTTFRLQTTVTQRDRDSS